MKNGFMTLLGLLIVTLLIALWFVSMYSKNSTTQKSQVDTYKQAIDSAEQAKKLLEGRTY